MGYEEDRLIRINLWHGYMDLSSSLDGPYSPGSQWLNTLALSFEEAWREGRLPTEGDHNDRGETGEYGSDVVGEVASACVPIPTNERWQVFVDLCAYGSEEAKDALKQGDITDATNWAGDVLDGMANSAGLCWLAEQIEARSAEEAESESPEEVDEFEDSETEALAEAPPACARQSAATQTSGLIEPVQAPQAERPPRADPPDSPARGR
ncbi:hypothetical protein [Streptacidiphilus neutrinimicus]|uniref:hypothetical protein n=1 Tax=Streptacidiphilus neutrinimicus TaxID=105420 RepID=UPI000AC5FF25|nr:hypothetical protein [Streptacidiphilus neutrinimicus]